MRQFRRSDDFDLAKTIDSEPPRRKWLSSNTFIRHDTSLTVSSSMGHCPVIHFADRVDQGLRFVELNIFRAIVSEDLFSVGGQCKPARLRSRRFLLIFEMLRRVGRLPLQVADTVVPRGEHSYRPGAEGADVSLQPRFVRRCLFHLRSKSVIHGNFGLRALQHFGVPIWRPLSFGQTPEEKLLSASLLRLC